MPTFHWIGKNKVINHHMDIPFKVLEHSYGFDNGKQSDQETHSGNKIIHCDNLEILKAFLPNTKGEQLHQRILDEAIIKFTPSKPLFGKDF